MANYTDPSGATPRWWTVLATCATTLAVVLVAGLGIWQAGVHEQSVGNSARARQVTTQVLARSEPAPPAAVRPTQHSIAPELILVGSTEQAARLQQGFDAADALRAQTGVGLLDDRVVQIAGDDEVDAAVQAVADENGFRAAAGLTPITVLDLRQPAAVPAQQNRPRAGAVPFVMDRQ